MAKATVLFYGTLDYCNFHVVVVVVVASIIIIVVIIITLMLLIVISPQSYPSSSSPSSSYHRNRLHHRRLHHRRLHHKISSSPSILVIFSVLVVHSSSTPLSMCLLRQRRCLDAALSLSSPHLLLLYDGFVIVVMIASSFFLKMTIN